MQDSSESEEAEKKVPSIFEKSLNYGNEIESSLAKNFSQENENTRKDETNVEIKVDEGPDERQ